MYMFIYIGGNILVVKRVIECVGKDEGFLLKFILVSILV